jgi:hypothetical protein
MSRGHGIRVLLANRCVTMGLTPPTLSSTLALTCLDGVAPVALIAEEDSHVLITIPARLPIAGFYQPSPA